MSEPSGSLFTQLKHRVTIYKYLPERYAGLFVEHGEILFRSLLYFLACEDARRDELEAMRQYEPVEGL